jgi:hypothetical protein
VLAFDSSLNENLPMRELEFCVPAPSPNRQTTLVANLREMAEVWDDSPFLGFLCLFSHFDPDIRGILSCLIYGIPAYEQLVDALTTGEIFTVAGVGRQQPCGRRLGAVGARLSTRADVCKAGEGDAPFCRGMGSSAARCPTRRSRSQDRAADDSRRSAAGVMGYVRSGV